MTERKNVQTVTKWVGALNAYSGRYKADERRATGATRHLRYADAYDSPSDVPDDCTPVRVLVETWEEEGEPERITEWSADEPPDGWDVAGRGSGKSYRVCRSYLHAAHERDRLSAEGMTIILLPVRIPTETKRTVTLDPEPDTQPPLVLTGHHSMKTMEAIAAAREHVARAFDTDPGAWRPDLVDRDGDVIQVRFRISGEPTETGCRCLEKVDEMLDDQSRAMAVNYRRGWIDALEAVRRNLADCDCKATETP